MVVRIRSDECSPLWYCAVCGFGVIHIWFSHGFHNALSIPCLLPPAGDLPLPVVRLFCSMRCDEKEINLQAAGPGFTLPDNIGDLDPVITDIDLSECNLIGL